MKTAPLVGASLLAVFLLCGCVSSASHTPQTPPSADTTKPADLQEMDDPLLYLTDADAPYTIVRPDDTGSATIGAMTALNEALGGGLTLETDWVPRGETPTPHAREILIGLTNRPESTELCAGLGEHDYRIAVIGDKLVIAAISDAAAANAVAALIRTDAIGTGERGYTVDRSLSLSFTGAADRAAYIANPDLFLCKWALDFDVPEWMTDYAEKEAAWNAPGGRMMSAIHRGEYFYYPENSIEGIISAIHMGCDSLELDCQLSADGVPVLMHDNTLQRTTDWETKAGKNGLPSSNQLKDWTLDELRQLRLRMNDGTQTDYLIPTLHEALTVCNGRIWLRLDKLNAWNWNQDIYPVIQKSGAYGTTILNHQFGLSRNREILAAIAADGYTGRVLFYHAYGNGEKKNWLPLLSTFEKLELTPIIWWTGYDKKDSSASLKSMRDYLSLIQGKVRIYVDAQARGGATESPAVWDELMQYGINFILVDDAMALQKYIARTCVPTPYESQK